MNEDGYEERMINDKMDGVCEGWYKNAKNLERWKPIWLGMKEDAVNFKLIKPDNIWKKNNALRKKAELITITKTSYKHTKIDEFGRRPNMPMCLQYTLKSPSFNSYVLRSSFESGSILENSWTGLHEGMHRSHHSTRRLHQRSNDDPA